jgi:hypothetical protein
MVITLPPPIAKMQPGDLWTRTRHGWELEHVDVALLPAPAPAGIEDRRVRY